MLGWPEDPVTEVPRTPWPSALRAVIVGDDLRCWFQPIVDVRDGRVVGYEALARIEGAAGPMGPAAWFAAARAHGVTAELEAACLAKALSHRPSLPPDCFLSVNVGPGVLTHPRLLAVLDSEVDLTGVVLELTEHVAHDTRADVAAALRPYREAGAEVAVDDTGAGSGALAHLLGLRPGVIKVDRSLVTDVDRDGGKQAAVRALGSVAERIEARLVAEGVERTEELDALADLRVGLAQGYVLARPAPPWQGVAEEVVRRLHARGARSLGRGGTLRDVVAPSMTVPDVAAARRAFATRPELDWVVVLDGGERPAAVADPESAGSGTAVRAVALHVDTPIAEAERRLVLHPPAPGPPGGRTGTAGPEPATAPRVQPLVCVDDRGRYVGIVPVERLVGRTGSR